MTCAKPAGPEERSFERRAAAAVFIVSALLNVRIAVYAGWLSASPSGILAGVFFQGICLVSVAAVRSGIRREPFLRALLWAALTHGVWILWPVSLVFLTRTPIQASAPPPVWIPALCCAAGWFVCAFGVETSVCLRAGRRPERRIVWAGAIGLILWVLLVMALTAIKAGEFGYRTGDAAIFERSFWKTIHGQWFPDDLWGKGDSLFASHFWPGLALLLPLYWIFPSIHALNFAQAVLVAASAVFLYRFSRKRMPVGAACCLSAAYLLHPGILGSLVYSFHADALAAPCLLGAVWAFESARFGRFLLGGVLAASAVEYAVLPLPLFSLMAWREKRPARWVWAPVMIFLVSTGLAAALIESPRGQIADLRVLTPAVLGAKGGFLLSLAAPLVFLPLGSVRVLFAAPVAALVLLFVPTDRIGFWLHAAIPVSLLLFPAAAESLRSLAARTGRAGLLGLLCARAVPLWLVVGSLCFAPAWIDPAEFRNPEREAFRGVLAALPAEGSVVAPRRLLLALAHRNEVYLYESGRFPDSVIVDLQGWETVRFQAYLQGVAAGGKYGEAYRNERFLLYVRKRL